MKAEMGGKIQYGLGDWLGKSTAKRSEFIEKGGWDKMPGQKEASYGVASACAEKLEAQIKK